MMLSSSSLMTRLMLTMNQFLTTHRWQIYCNSPLRRFKYPHKLVSSCVSVPRWRWWWLWCYEDLEWREQKTSGRFFKVGVHSTTDDIVKETNVTHYLRTKGPSDSRTSDNTADPGCIGVTRRCASRLNNYMYIDVHVQSWWSIQQY